MLDVVLQCSSAYFEEEAESALCHLSSESRMKVLILCRILACREMFGHARIKTQLLITLATICRLLSPYQTNVTSCSN